MFVEDVVFKYSSLKNNLFINSQMFRKGVVASVFVIQHVKYKFLS
jgi:hypothetical protein